MHSSTLHGYKLKVDGSSSKKNAAPSSMGAAINDKNGTIIMFFFGLAGICDSNRAEKILFKEGYKLFHSSLYGVMVIEGDSKILNTWDSGLAKAPWPLFYIPKQIKTLLRDINATSCHVPREPNEIANNWRYGSQKEGFIIVDWLITWLPFVIFCGLLTHPFTPFGLLIFV